MPNVLVLGGGFAGVWTAAGIMRAQHEHDADHKDIRVTLVDAGDDIVIRPRLYEHGPGNMRVALDRILGPIGVRRIAATVTSILTDDHLVTAVDRSGEPLALSYDRLVLATGSRLVPPPFSGAEHVFDVDTMTRAAELEAHLSRLTLHPEPGRHTAVIIGAGFTGLELATELPARLRAVAGENTPIRVVLVERADSVGPELGDGPRPVILEALEQLGVEVRLGTSVSEAGPNTVALSDGAVIPARTVIWTGGMRASRLTEQIPGEHDQLGRLRVDEYLRVIGVPDVFAAGDTAAALVEPGRTVMQSCQHAVPQGKFAGRNVGSDLLGLSMVTFAPDPYVTCLDLGAAGAVVTSGWDRAVVQSGEEAKQLKRQINAQWIYPPVDDPDKILAWADHRKTWPTEEAPWADPSAQNRPGRL